MGNSTQLMKIASATYIVLGASAEEAGCPVRGAYRVGYGTKDTDGCC